MLVPSCCPSDDTLHKLINIPFWLHSLPIASGMGTTLSCAFKAEESDTAVLKRYPQYAYALKKTDLKPSWTKILRKKARSGDSKLCEPRHRSRSVGS